MPNRNPVGNLLLEGRASGRYHCVSKLETAMTYQSEYLQILHERGYIHQVTDAEGLDAYLKQPDAVGYIGFDCTAPSLHVGSLIQIMLLHWFQKCGHKPIVLMGGGTTKVGDPSGKDESRKLLNEADIANNLAGIRRVFDRFVAFDGANAAVMVNNADWLDKLNYIEFLRDYGRHFSVNRMLSMESVKLRLEREHHLSFLEFNYMVLQAYDFTELFRRYGCRLQLGGSDQWGNIVNGIDLNHAVTNESNAGKPLSGAQLFGLTTPLLTTSTGAKMGKTAQGAIWLSEDMLSPYDYWQFWRNTSDADVGRFLKLFTTLPLDDITRLEALEGAELNEAKKILATEVTAMCHGREAAEAAAETARRTFEQGGAGDALPVVEIPRQVFEEGIPAFALFTKTPLVASGSEARKLIRGGGARIDDAPVTNENEPVSFPQGADTLKLSAGKKRHVIVKIV